jgi:hypothetical protein
LEIAKVTTAKTAKPLAGTLERTVITVDPAQQLASADKLALAMTELAGAYDIQDAATAEMAAQDLRKIKTKIAEVNETRLSITRPLDQAKDATMAAFRPYLERLELAAGVLDKGIRAFMAREAERVQRERAEAEAAERQRLEDLRAQQAAAEAAGDTEAAVAAQTAAEDLEFAPTTHVERAAKLTGVNTRANWKVRSIDLAALVTEAAKRLAAGDDSYLAYLEANTTAINGVVKAMKDRTSIAGVAVHNDVGLSARKI